MIKKGRGRKEKNKKRKEKRRKARLPDTAISCSRSLAPYPTSLIWEVQVLSLVPFYHRLGKKDFTGESDVGKRLN